MSFWTGLISNSLSNGRKIWRDLQNRIREEVKREICLVVTQWQGLKYFTAGEDDLVQTGLQI